MGWQAHIFSAPLKRCGRNCGAWVARWKFASSFYGITDLLSIAPFFVEAALTA